MLIKDTEEWAKQLFQHAELGDDDCRQFSYVTLP
jgi:hypothetical protein